MIRRYQRGSVRKKNGNYVLRYREDCFTPGGKAERPQKTIILGPVSAFRGKNEARKAAVSCKRSIRRPPGLKPT
jgi:hypothetical protein